MLMKEKRKRILSGLDENSLELMVVGRMAKKRAKMKTQPNG